MLCASKRTGLSCWDGLGRPGVGQTKNGTAKKVKKLEGKGQDKGRSVLVDSCNEVGGGEFTVLYSSVSSDGDLKRHFTRISHGQKEGFAFMRLTQDALFVPPDCSFSP